MNQALKSTFLVTVVALGTGLLVTACGGDDGAVVPVQLDSGTGGQDTALLDTALTDTPVTDVLVEDLAQTTDAVSPLDVPVLPDVPLDVQIPFDVSPACPADHCAIGEACVVNLTAHPTNPCLRCFALTDNKGWSPDDAAKCDDDSKCTPDDHCSDGACTGTPSLNCDDGESCTKDDCDLKGGCTHVKKADVSACDDGNQCTSGDICIGGVCLAGDVTTDCDDKDTCTTDACDTKLGCIHTVTATGACDDGSACTQDDTCGNTGCIGALIDCDDHNVCTIDSCDPVQGCVHDGAIANYCKDSNPCTDEGCDPTMGCVYPANSAACSDGNECTTGDHCEGGACKVQKVDCDDQNPCTDDTCNPTSGVCTGLPNAATCTDDDACTLGDYCTSGTCYPGEGKPNCDDGNPCTLDQCDAVKGCFSGPGIGKCDDNNTCTVNDYCANSGCTGFPLDCDDNSVCTVDSCDPVKGCQHDDAIAKNCVDSNPCTDQFCDPKSGCVYPFNTEPCNDENVCTNADTCSQGACLGQLLDPNDNNPCTNDYCDKDTGPWHQANTLPCDDNNVCTLGDVCADSACTAGVGKKVCDDGLVCTDDFCDPTTGCGITPNTANCDDGTVCTSTDKCADGDCHGTPIVCNDNNECTADSCDAVKGCKYTLIVNHKCRPNIVIDFPPRAATLDGDPAITVLGHVTDAAGPITSVTVNGSTVSVDPSSGAFSYPMDSGVGGNEIVVVATDSFGTTKQVVQSYLWSTKYYKPVWGDHSQGIVDPGLAYYLSKSVIDDGVHTLPANDLATVFEQVLATYKLETYIPSSISASGITVNISNLKYGKPKVVLTPNTGFLHMAAKIPTISADLKVSIIPGTLTADSLNIDTDLVMTVDANHNAVVTMTNTSVTFTNFVVKVIGINVNFLLGSTITNLTNSLVPQLKTALEPALTSAFNGLAFKTQFQLGKLDGSGGKITVDLYNDYNDIKVATDGMTFLLRPRASAELNPALANYDAKGIPARIHCADGLPQALSIVKSNAQSEMDLSIADDTFNELLGAVWSGGLLEFPVGASLLGNIDLSTYGVSDLAMNVDAMLPPVMEDCGYANPVAQIGDLRVYGSMKLFGKVLTFTMYATFKTDVAVTAANGAIGISLSGIKSADVEVDIVEDEMVGSEQALADLIKSQVLGALVGQLTGSALGSFPIPAINLNVGGASVSLSLATDQVVRDEGNSVVQGHLQ